MLRVNKLSSLLAGLSLVVPGGFLGSVARGAEAPPAIPRFSLSYMERDVEPGKDFYRFAAGAWVKSNPVPADKARWSGFDELQERNQHLLRAILENVATEPSAPPRSPRRQVGDFYLSIMDT